MSKLWLGVISLVMLSSLAGNADSGEFLWKLARIDNDSVTLIGADDIRKTAKICREDRSKVAAFLGKSVKVDFEDLKGEPWVVRLESWK
jgi:hypothetical protein